MRDFNPNPNPDDRMTLSLGAPAVDLAVDLVTLLAANAYEIIEHDPEAFRVVQERRGHSGSSTLKIDHDNMQLARVWATLPRVTNMTPTGTVHIKSEETSEAWDPKAEPHDMILRLDEFDGTSIAAAVGTAWSIAALVFIWSGRYSKYVLAGGAIALSDGHVIRFVNKTRHNIAGLAKKCEASVSIGRFNIIGPQRAGSSAPVTVHPFEDVEELPSDGEPDKVVINAAVGKRRIEKVLAKHPALLSETSFHTVCGGTPMVYGALRGQVAMVVDPDKSTLHDSTHLFPLNALGWTTIDLETRRPINIVELAEAHATEDGSHKPLPSTATYRNADALKFLG